MAELRFQLIDSGLFTLTFGGERPKCLVVYILPTVSTAHEHGVHRAVDGCESDALHK